MEYEGFLCKVNDRVLVAGGISTIDDINGKERYYLYVFVCRMNDLVHVAGGT